MGYLSKIERVQSAQLLLGALAFDAGQATRAIVALAKAVPSQPHLHAVVEHALGRLVPGQLPGFSWLIALLDEAKLSAGVQFGADLTLFRKSLLTLQGVVADVCAQTTLDRVLPAWAIRELFKDWPGRAFASPLSRAFGTHLSTLDLLSLSWSLPPALARRAMAMWKALVGGS